MKTTDDVVIDVIIQCVPGQLLSILRRYGYNDHSSELRDTPLCVAMDLGYFDDAEMLLEFGANPNRESLTHGMPLEIAVRQANEDFLRLLVKYGADLRYRIDGLYSYLDMAYDDRNHVAAYVLLSLGLPVEDSVLAQQGDDSYHWFVSVAPAFYAAERGDIDLLKHCLQTGTDVDILGRDGGLLHYATRRNDQQMVRFLLSVGADPNIESSIGNLTALETAARLKYPEIIRALLEAGANVDPRIPGKPSALIYATQRGDFDAVRLLVEAGADVTVRTRFNETALGIARKEPFSTIVPLLLQAGAEE